MASTVNITRFVRGGKIGDNAQAVRVISNVVDFSLLGVALNDVVGALKLNAGTIVFSVGAKCIDAGSSGITFTMGDKSAVDTYYTAQAADSAALDIGKALAAPIYYKAEDYITMVSSGTWTAGKYFVWAVVANVHGNV